MRKLEMNRFIKSFIFILFFSTGADIASQERVYNNPIITGFYPDPSICRVNDDYYLVNSSFEYFPGVPIFKSKDLVNWTQIGNVLDRPSQLQLDSVKYGVSGIFAPSIRFHNGIYYMTTTMVGSKDSVHSGNFICTARNPEGPWSDPFYLDGAPGIDPCLFFDEDGKSYFIGTRFANSDEQKYWKHSIIWMKELDAVNMRLLGDEKVILAQGGALHDARNAEGPRLFKRNGFYYLIVAEGGTGHEHAVTVFRSKKIEGPYETNPRNPILTNRHLGMDYPIQNAGHADLVETQSGDWWMVALGIRPYANGTTNLARETFLVPMIWEDNWPVGAPATGHVCMQHPAPKLPEHKYPSVPTEDHFDSSKLEPYWNFIRTPNPKSYSLSERKGFLRLYSKPQTVSEEVSPSFVGRRQQHKNFVSDVFMEYASKKEGEEFGLVVFQSPRCHYRLVKKDILDSASLVLIKTDNGVETEVGLVKCDEKRVGLRVTAIKQQYSFYYSVNGKQWHPIGSSQDGKILTSNYCGGYTGAYIGMYASSNGNKSNSYSDFDSFSYKEAFE